MAFDDPFRTTPAQVEPEPTPEPTPTPDPTPSPEPGPTDPVDTENLEDTPPEPEPEDNTDFWADVDQLRGEALEVDYGDVDPVSPEGAYIREQVVEKKAVENYDTYLRTTYPRAYAYFMHTEQGGTDEEFLGKMGGFQLPKWEEVSSSVDLQRQVVEADLRNKGNSEKNIGLIVNAMMKDGELGVEAEQAYNAIRQNEEAYIRSMEEEVERNSREIKEAANFMTNAINSTIQAQANALHIPETKRQALVQNLQSKLQYSEGKFFLVEEVNPQELGKVIDKEYFGLTKGNLKDLIQREAGKKVVKKLGVAVDNQKKTLKTTGTEEQAKFLRVSDL